MHMGNNAQNCREKKERTQDHADGGIVFKWLLWGSERVLLYSLVLTGTRISKVEILWTKLRTSGLPRKGSGGPVKKKIRPPAPSKRRTGQES